MRSPVAVLLLSIFLLLTVSCCDDVPSGTGDDKPGLQRGDTAVSTLVVYMMAENSLAGFAATDIEEIRRGTVSVPADSRLFVFVDDRENPRLLQFKNSDDGVVEQVLHAYIPDIAGKERRKDHASKAGLIGVEGMEKEELIRILSPFISDATPQKDAKMITKVDFYMDKMTYSFKWSV